MSRRSDIPELEQLALGATLAFENAQDLFREAAVLYATRSYARALFLHQISMEECGKIEILGAWATGHLLGFSSDPRKMARAFAPGDSWERC